jgi:hypothetical protein
MLRQEELPYIKANYTLQLSHALLKEHRMVMSRRKKKPVVPAGSRSTTSGGGARAPPTSIESVQGQAQCQRAGKLGRLVWAREQAPSTRRWVRASSRHLFSHEPTSFCWHPATRASEGGVKYAAVLAGSVAPFQPRGSLKPTAMGSDKSEPAVSTETANRRMSSDMSESLSDKPDGTNPNAQVAITCLPAGQRPNKTPIFITGVSDARTFLPWLRASCPGGLTTKLKGEKLMVVPSTAQGFRATISALWSLDGGGVWVFTPSHSRRTETSVRNYQFTMRKISKERRSHLEDCNLWSLITFTLSEFSTTYVPLV